VTEASRVRPFEVSCRGEDVRQLTANVRLKEDFANMIVGLLAHSAVDHTVYLGMHKYGSMADRDFGALTSQVEHIPRVGRWFLVIYHQLQYQSVRIDWEESTISVFNPYYPFFVAGHSPPTVHVARQHQEVVYDVSTAILSLLPSIGLTFCVVAYGRVDAASLRYGYSQRMGQDTAPWSVAGS
jgi:hypothetical protein